MIAEIAARHGVRLDKDDPAFLLVDLNMMALEEETGQLSKWKDDVAVLIGALHDGSKKWEDTASAIGKSIFDGHKQAFVKDIEQERTAFLGAARTELNSVMREAVGPVVRELEAATARSRSSRAFWSATVGVMIGSVIGCAATLYVAKQNFIVDEPAIQAGHSINKGRK